MKAKTKSPGYAPEIKTALPGPKSKAIIAKDEKYVSHSYTRAYPTVIERGQGAYLWDVDGNCFLDFHSGIAVCATGNAHPDVVAAVKKQADKTLHIATADFYHDLVAPLAEKLARLAPGKKPKRVFFTNSGTESVEAALKLARYKTKRPRFMAFINAFHGRSMGSVSLTCSKKIQRAGFSPLLEVTHVPYANCYRCPYHLEYPSCEMHCVKVIENTYLDRVAPAEDVAAIFVEPAQGEGGYIVPPKEFHPMLKEIAKKYGILYVSDEVQWGMGKTGKMWCIEHWDCIPDIITTAKAIASGLPLGACIADADLMDWPPGAHSTTFGGNPLACAAAIETIRLLEEGLMENARVMGDYCKGALLDLKKKHRSIGDVRGLGLLLAMEFVLDRKTKEPAKAMANDIMMRCFELGLMTLTCGQSCIRLCPPLVVDRATLDQGLDILDRVITEMEKKHLK
jgi:4-aminobutyrate aminotransferase